MISPSTPVKATYLLAKLSVTRSCLAPGQCGVPAHCGRTNTDPHQIRRETEGG